MAEPWYRTETWTDEDEHRLSGRLNRYNSAFSRAQVLRIKALTLEKSGNASLLPTIEKLLHMVTDDPAITLACTDTGVACEVSACHLKLTLIHSQRQEHSMAEAHFRKDLEISKTPGCGLIFALFLSGLNDPGKLKEADRLLDQVRDTKEPPQLMFRISQLRYNVARARICGKTGRLDEGREYAKAALLLDGADGIDAFKRKPLDSPLLDPQLRSEMESMASGVSQPSGKQE